MKSVLRHVRFADSFVAQLRQQRYRYQQVRRRSAYTQLCHGFFRCMPLHAWPTAHVHALLAYAAQHPARFGLPDQPTCIVDTSALTSAQCLLPLSQQSLRQQQQQQPSRAPHGLGGVCVFGVDRGCRSIVVPPSCTRAPLSADDARALAPLFRWNPGVELVYLSCSCQPVAAQLATYLAHCHKVHTVVLPGWHDAAALHRVVMACKHADVLDAYMPIEDGARRSGNYVTGPRVWGTELAVQALTTLVEMHPRLRVVRASQRYLDDWRHATRLSRCKHVVALIEDRCRYMPWYELLFCLMLVLLPMAAVYALAQPVCRACTHSDVAADACATLPACLVATTLIVVETRRRRVRGPAWLCAVKHVVLLMRRRGRH